MTMRVKWSRHAHDQRMDIVRIIFREQTREIASAMLIRTRDTYWN